MESGKSGKVVNVAAYIICSALLAGCATPPPPISISLIGKAVGEVKHQVGIYQSIVQADPLRYTKLPPVENDKVCGPGLVDFDITSVTVALTTKVETNTNGTVAGTAPIGASGATIGAGLGGGNDVTNSQVLTFNMYPILPVTYERTPGADDLNRPENAVAATLIAFRTALRGAAVARPCFSTVHDADKDADNTLVVGVEAVTDFSQNVTLKLAFVDLAFSHDQKNTQGSTLTFSFRPYIPVKPVAGHAQPTDGTRTQAGNSASPGGNGGRRERFDLRRRIQGLSAPTDLPLSNAQMQAPKI